MARWSISSPLNHHEENILSTFEPDGETDENLSLAQPSQSLAAPAAPGRVPRLVMKMSREIWTDDSDEILRLGYYSIYPIRFKQYNDTATLFVINPTKVEPVKLQELFIPKQHPLLIIKNLY